MTSVSSSTDDAIVHFASHVINTRFEDIPPDAITAAKTFLLDTLGVGLAGSSGPFVPELIETQQLSSPGEQARVWASGEYLSAAGAAFCNSYQIHNSEFDCVHEAAVVHTMTVLTAAVLAYAEREGGISGKQLLVALVLGVDVACNLGVASRSPLRFFRPATAGGFAATAGIGKLMGFDQATLVNAFGALHSQLCGTMQAHTEGSIVLGLQVGYNARNAVLACDMAARGLVAPHQVLEGRFGFFPLFEGEHDLASVLPTLGRVWRITEVAHKPFPSGRATHGVIDAGLELQRQHGFSLADIASIDAQVPALVHHLVGRPLQDEMTLNYARLCVQFTVAKALQQGGLTVTDFQPDALRDGDTHALARRVSVGVDDNPDPNALTPVTVTITLRDGQRLSCTRDVVYGNPARPMSRSAQLDKLAANWATGTPSVPASNAATLADTIDALETVPNVCALVDLLVGK
jgi:aconitate decarboxylase